MKTAAVISGGRSPEHEISMISAKNILVAIDQSIFKPIWIVASTTNKWYLVPCELWSKIKKVDNHSDLIEIQWCTSGIICNGLYITIDVAFPIMHGRYGEDGHLQGFLTMLSIPYTGSKVMASVLGMNKHLFKVMMNHVNLPVLPYITLTSVDVEYTEVQEILISKQLFIKPSNSGSSYGTAIVRNEKEWKVALKLALEFDNIILVEPYLQNVQEIECAVWLDRGIASTLGEINCIEGFYDYNNKYLNATKTVLHVPANIAAEESSLIQNMALEACKVLGVAQYARVDFFKDNSLIYINEINTLPGFTAISMFPSLLAYDAYTIQEVINSLLLAAVK